MLSPFAVSYALLWVLVLALAVAVLICIRQLGEVYLIGSGLRGIAGDGLDEGRTGANLRLRLADGTEATLLELLPDGGVLVFASSKCRICEILIPRLAADGFGRETVIAYDELPAHLQRQGEDGHIVMAKMLDLDGPTKFKVRVTPFAFGLDGTLQVRSRGLVNTSEQVAFHRLKGRQFVNLPTASNA